MKKVLSILGFLMCFMFVSTTSQAQSMAEQATSITDNMQEKTNFLQSKYDQVYDINMTFVQGKENLGQKPAIGTPGYQTWVSGYQNLIATRKTELSTVLSEQEMSLLTKGQRN